ncbi:MAG: Flp family type IVb pilin [Chloroflexia bacterium]|nr:Flp family type IVb pilin [Chloroflexia bacterium]
MTQAYIYAQYLVADAKSLVLTPRKGQGMVEYALILALIAIVVIGAVTVIGTGANNKFGQIGGELD